MKKLYVVALIIAIMTSSFASGWGRWGGRCCGGARYANNWGGRGGCCGRGVGYAGFGYRGYGVAEEAGCDAYQGDEYVEYEEGGKVVRRPAHKHAHPKHHAAATEEIEILED